jgi:F-type H+-transporting ATPase subunit b
MDETLRQLGGLLIGSIPTIVLFVCLFVAYRFIVHAPLQRVLDERHSRTEGALDRARADIAAAEAKTSEYETALRDARLAVFKAQEARRQKAMEVRAASVSAARKMADQKLQEARAALEKEVAVSKLSLQSESERLATEVIEAIFRQVGAVQAPAGGGQR